MHASSRVRLKKSNNLMTSQTKGIENNPLFGFEGIYKMDVIIMLKYYSFTCAKQQSLTHSLTR